MRYGVLADIHANLPALDAALAVLERERVDGYICAGDLVGYGPFPNECVARVRALGAVCVAGNHDLMALGRLADDSCIALARESLRWTRGVLDAGARRYLAGLPLRAAVSGVVVAHGALDDPQTYTLTRGQVAGQLDVLASGCAGIRVLVLGHTHLAQARDRDGATLGTGPGGVVRLPSHCLCLLNPGAVGQSRERLLRARFMTLDLSRSEATFYAVPYDVERCRRQLEKVGLSPRSLRVRPSLLHRALPVVRGVAEGARRATARR